MCNEILSEITRSATGAANKNVQKNEEPWAFLRMQAMNKTKIGVIGGSGIYEIDSLQNPKWQQVESPWGVPSDELLTGQLAGVEMVFLPRHGRGHVHAPSDVPYRANIDSLKRLGVTDVISVSACGSFRNEMAPGHFVIVDQFIDRTTQRASSFSVSYTHLTLPTSDLV